MPIELGYPILYGPGSEKPHKHPTWPLTVPWAVVEPHEAQARSNHGQTLRRLAERGGLCLQEMVAVLADKEWRVVKHLSDDQAAAHINDLVRQWRKAQV